MPKELSVALRSYDSTSASGSATFAASYGLVEFLNIRPLFAAQLFTIYRYCKITAVDIDFTIVNAGAVPLQVAVGYVPQTLAGAMTQERLTEKAGSIRRLISATGGMDRVTIRRTFNVEEVLGEPVLSKYWFDATQSVSATPIDTNEPVISICGAPYAGNITASLSTVVTFHCQFFDLTVPALS